MKFTRNYILIRDIELIKKITEKDFNYFYGGPKCCQFKNSILSTNLSNLGGDNWRDMRATLCPVFTSNKIRNMYPLIERCAQNFINHYKAEVEIEVKEVFTKFANDVIASIAFGTEIDSLKEAENDFYTNASVLSNFINSESGDIKNVSKVNKINL